jgi:hypothetical protein
LRTFSATPRRPAAEVPDEFINAIKHTPLFQKLADKPNALKALSDLYALTKEMGALLSFRFVLRDGGYSSLTTTPIFIFSSLALFTLKKGLDINSTTPPSQYEMFRLVTNRKFVRAVRRVMEELNVAGLKMNSDVRTPQLVARGCLFIYFDLPQDALQEIIGLAQGNPPKKDDS